MTPTTLRCIFLDFSMTSPSDNPSQQPDSLFVNSAGEELKWAVGNSAALPFSRLADWARKGDHDARLAGNLSLALKNGANPNMRSSEFGQNLLSYACSQGSWKMAILLLEAGAAPVPFATGASDDERGPGFSEPQFNERNHPILASLKFLAANQDALLSRWAQSNAPASEAAKLRDRGFEAFLSRWIEAGGSLSTEKTSSKAVREIFSHPVFSAAHAFLDQRLDASIWDAEGIFPLARLARSKKLRPLGQPADRFLSDRPALREAVADLGTRLIRLAANCDALMSLDSAATPAPENLAELFRNGDTNRIPGFDAHLRERLFSAIEEQELLHEMRRSFYSQDPSPIAGPVRLPNRL